MGIAVRFSSLVTLYPGADVSPREPGTFRGTRTFSERNVSIFKQPRILRPLEPAA